MPSRDSTAWNCGSRRGTFSVEMLRARAASVSRQVPLPSYMHRPDVSLCSSPSRSCEKIFVSLHAPHRAVEAHAIADWWGSHLRLIQQHATRALTILCGDCNAAVAQLLGIIKRRPRAWCPATFEANHHGPGWTFQQRRGGRQTRADYVAIPADWKPGEVTSCVEHGVHALGSSPDHYATVVTVQVALQFRIRRSQVGTGRIDIKQLALPESRHRLSEILRRAPTISWENPSHSHACQLVEYLQQQLTAAFPCPRSGPRQPYLTEDTWRLHAQLTRVWHTNARLLTHIRSQCLRVTLRAWAASASHRPFADPGLSWFKEANRAGAILSYGLRHLGDRLRKACRQDRINYLCQLADTVQQGGLNEAYPQLRRLLGHRRKRPFTPDTLPTLRKVNGELCASPEEVAARWREHFSELEGGHVVSPGDLLASAARGDQLGSWPLPDTISRLPTLTDLQNILLRAGRRKAPGPDRLPAEIGIFAAADMARLLHPLSLKLALRGSEGLGMKSGALVKLYKQKGSREECKAHRGILLLSTLSKTVHQSLRPTLAAHHEAKARPLQLSSRKGMTSLFGAHCVRLFLAHRRRKKQPAAVLFTDIESAYYATTRGLAMRRPGADPVSAVTLSGETNEGRRQELHDLLTGGTALADEGLHRWAEAVAAEIRDTTWMTICGDRVPLQTHRGTRPGSAYADLIFAAVVRKVLAYRDQEREQHPHCAPVAHVNWDGSFSLGPRQHPCHRELLDDVVWADDISRCIAPATSSQLRRATVAEAGLLSTAFQAHGFQLSYGVSKSATALPCRPWCPAGTPKPLWR